MSFRSTIRLSIADTGKDNSERDTCRRLEQREALFGRTWSIRWQLPQWPLDVESFAHIPA
jgi:hypothetical protein